MAEDALNFLLRNLQTTVGDHYNLVSRAGNELKLLEGEVNSMTAFLKELAEHPSRGDLLKLYETEVRDVAHEAQDILDECLTRAALHKSTMFVTRFFNPKHASSANQVKSLRKETIKPLFEKYGIGKITPLPLPQISHSTITKPNDDIVKVNYISPLCIHSHSFIDVS